MLNQLLGLLAFAAALGAGLIGGVFYAFSTVVMKALARRPVNDAIAAMQAINVAVMNPMFRGAFLGTAAVSAVVILGAALQWERLGAGWLLGGGLLYFLGKGNGDGRETGKGNGDVAS